MATTETGFGELLRRYRIAAGLTQEELAERAGVSTRGISDLERGARGLPRKDTLQLLLQGLELSPTDRVALIAAARRSPRTCPGSSRTERLSGLPVPFTPLIGRELEIGAVAAHLAEPHGRLLTLTGPGGTGKTRLALAVAERVVPDFPDGVVFVSLAPVGDPAFVISAVAQHLGIREVVGQNLLDRLVAYLADQRLLLILDNFEHLLPAAPLVVDLLAADLGLKVLVTSRAALHLSGEQIFPVPPLGLPDPGHLPPREALAQTEAVRLFVDRAQALKPGFALSEENAPTVAEIVRRLDGLPLALELAAARVPVLSPAALLARLDRRLPLLTGGAQDLPERHKTLRATIAWSYDLLDPAEQALFRRLGVFAGSWTLEAAEAVCDPLPDGDIDLLDGLTSLVNHSLVHRHDADDEPRFGMLETVRAYALERLEASGEADEIRRRHAVWCLKLAEWAADASWEPQQRSRLQRLATDIDNARAALAWSFGIGETTLGIQLATAMANFWSVHGPVREGRSWLDRALALTSPDRLSALRARVLFAAGLVASRQQDLPRAEALLRESLILWRELEETRGEAEALFFLGLVRQMQELGSDARGAGTLFARALALCQELEHPLLRYALMNLGLVAHKCGDDMRALRLLEEAAALFAQHGDEAGRAMSLHVLALVAQDRGEARRAVTLAATGLQLVRDAGDQGVMLDTVLCIASAAAMLGQREAAGRLLGAVDRRAEMLGILPDPDFVARRERGMAALQAKIGRRRTAELVAAGQAVTFDQAVNEALVLAETLSAVGRQAVPTVAAAPADPATRLGLTPREFEVLRLVATGRSNREIAETLFISVPTVKRHLTNVLGKLNLPSRSALNTYAHTHGLV